MNVKFSLSNLNTIFRHLGLPVFLIIIFAMLILPLPPFCLDILFTFNIAFALVILLATIYTDRPLDFAVFPSLLLIATLVRLGLNVASTRIVLLNGHLGTDAAGRVIEAFGGIVIGNNYTVGLVIFAILVIVNFVVVTKGANRVSEVSARFTLDALPGKQLAIDSDFQNGLIDKEQAIKRRLDLSHESDFYGSMDGASKFVRGDAIAGLIILFINIVGGIFIGVVQHNMALSVATQNYVLLTIGDGLVAQIPALFLSTAAALIVTRTSTAQNLGRALYQQLFRDPKNLWFAGGVIAVLALFPGMPEVIFMSMALTLMLLGSFIHYRYHRSEIVPNAMENQPPKSLPELNWNNVTIKPGIECCVGYGLLKMLEPKSPLLEQLSALRRQLSQRYGFIIPEITLRDDLEAPSDAYRIYMNGLLKGEGTLRPDAMLAIDTGAVETPIFQSKSRDPIYNYPAQWLKPMQRLQAERAGYALVDPCVLLVTHCHHLIKGHLDNCFGHEELSGVLSTLSQHSPRLESELRSSPVSRGVLLQVFQNLLAEQVPISLACKIIEVILRESEQSQNPDILTTRVRCALNDIVMQSIGVQHNALEAFCMDAELECNLHSLLEENARQSQEHMQEVRQMDDLIKLITEKCSSQAQSILMVPEQVRLALARKLRRTLPSCRVIADTEIPGDVSVHLVPIKRVFKTENRLSRG